MVKQGGFGFSLRGSRHVKDPIKDRYWLIVKRGKSCRTKSKKSSRGNGRYFHGPG